MKGKRILIVDDSSLMRTFVREAVESISKDVEVYGAGTGEAALEYLRRMPFDLVLCDWNMPRMNGLELLQLVRENDRINKTPFIMITGNDEKSGIVKLVKMGIRDYIIKPVSIEVLSARIRNVLYGPAPAPTAEPTAEPAVEPAVEPDGPPETTPEGEGQPALNLLAGNKERLTKMARKFADSCREAPQEIKALLARSDMEGAVRMAHTIKGNAGIIGAAGLQQAARQLEELLQAGEDQQRDEALALFERELGRVLAAVDSLPDVAPPKA